MSKRTEIAKNLVRVARKLTADKRGPIQKVTSTLVKRLEPLFSAFDKADDDALFDIFQGTIRDLKKLGAKAKKENDPNYMNYYVAAKDAEKLQSAISRIAGELNLMQESLEILKTI